MTQIQPRATNHLLAAISSEQYSRIAPHLTARPLSAHQILRRRGEALHEVYFPSRSLCSLVIAMEDGATSEIAVVGAEGIVGVEAAFGQSAAACDVTVQAAGDGIAHVMHIDAFRREFERREAFYAAITNYLRAFIGLVTQSVACNGLHSAEARCCRWLLHARDRLGTTDLPLTHELLATMLAVRRPTVTLVMADLTRAEIISTRRGVIRIVDSTGLEARSCECYRSVKRLFENLMANVRTTPPISYEREQRWPEPSELTS